MSLDYKTYELSASQIMAEEKLTNYYEDSSYHPVSEYLENNGW